MATKSTAKKQTNGYEFADKFVVVRPGVVYDNKRVVQLLYPIGEPDKQNNQLWRVRACGASWKPELTFDMDLIEPLDTEIEAINKVAEEEHE